MTKKKGEHRILFGDPSWTDMEIQVTATLEKGKGYGIFYRISGAKKLNGYLFQYDPGGNPNSFLVRKVVDGQVLEFDDDEFTEGKAGFRKWDNSDVSFTNAVVLEVEEP